MGQGEQDKRALFQDAEYFLMTEDYQEALSAYLRLNWADRQNANIAYRIGMCYLNIPGEKIKALPYLKLATQHISDRYTESTFNERQAPPQTLFLLGTAYQIDNQLEKAKQAFRKYKTYLKVKDVYEIDFVNRQIKACDIAARLMNEPVPVKAQIADDIIPQNRSNFGAVLSIDGNTIMYMTEEKFYKAIWMVKKQHNTWTNPVNITPQVESDGDARPTSLSPDGTTLYLVRSSDFDADIYVSHFSQGTWSKMKKLGKPVNTKYYETHASISPDGNTLYFTSNRKDGLGGMDIYSSKRDKKGKWSDPVNLGPDINTPYNEATPFICQDGVTLFFSSQGHESMGGFDTYKSTKQPNGQWSEPVNIGYPLNTTDDNMFFYPVDNGKKALYAGAMGNRNDYGSVKEIDIRPVKPGKQVAINGKLQTGDNLNELDTSFVIVILNKNDNDTIDIVKPDPATGIFSDSLFTGNYEFIASANGYQTQVKSVSLQDDYQRSTLDLDFDLVSEKVSSGEYIVIKNILFDYNSHALSDAAILDIERLYQVMKKYHDLYVEVIGHTDSRGNAAYNYELSQKRAHAVIRYLTGKGIDPVRFVSKGVGETSNIALNVNPDGTDNPEGRRLNRSAEIRILQPEHYKVRIEPVAIPDYLKPDRINVFTIRLLTSPEPLNNNRFDPLHKISGEPVNEEYTGNTYNYTFGKFYSRIQAEELLKSYVIQSYPSAEVIKSNDLPGREALRAKVGPSGGNQFGIQIIALRKPANLSSFSNLDDVEVIKSDDGFYRVIYGNFDSRQEADRDLDKVKRRGYDDAFVIDLSRLHKKQQSGNGQGGLYTIQLKALRTPVRKSYFARLGNIRVIEGDDGIFRYLYLEFSDLITAQQELSRIKKLGFSDAFVRKTSQIPGY
ncbi:MAG TPA: OmpA family protein [Bacteroidales bacterium]|nr:OmpA family protein [Bacteroidales bacterium]